MKKVFLTIFSIPMFIAFYIPTILLFLEFETILYPKFIWWRNLISFVGFWGGIGLWLWCFELLYTTNKISPIYSDVLPKLVTKGPYRFSRNPMAIAYWLVLASEAFFYNSYAILAWFLIFVAYSIFYIKNTEEPKMLKQFGEEYMEYRASVPMFL